MGVATAGDIPGRSGTETETSLEGRDDKDKVDDVAAGVAVGVAVVECDGGITTGFFVVGGKFWRGSDGKF